MPFGSLCVVGLGYIGLPTAIVFAEHGLTVYGVDVKPAAVEAINQGVAPFVEASLQEHLAPVVADGRLTASLEPRPADVTVIAVPTPFLPDKSADLSYVRAAALAVAPVLYPGALLILESTVGPGATEQLGGWIAAARPDLVGADGELLVDVAHAPERVLPGRVLVELTTNDRIVGGLTERATQRARDFYAVICQGEILLTDAKTAELSKCVENSFRDVNIAFANELSVICRDLGVDVWRLIELANHHPRVNILNPGPGVGGHCLAIDPWFIVAADPVNARLIRLSREINDGMPDRVVEQVLSAAVDLKTPVIAALGLAFKPNIDDLRESPAVHVVQKLASVLDEGRILAVEPNIAELPVKLSGYGNVELVSYDEAVEQADVVVLLVNHDEFVVRPDLGPNVKVIDTRGVWR